MRPIPSLVPLRRNDRSPLDTRNGGVGDAAFVGQKGPEKAVVIPVSKGLRYALLLVRLFGWDTDRGRGRDGGAPPDFFGAVSAVEDEVPLLVFEVGVFVDVVLESQSRGDLGGDEAR